MNRIFMTSVVCALTLNGASAFAMPAGHKMEHPTAEPAGAAMDHGDHCGLPMGEGAIAALDVAKAKVKITHKPIASIGWSAMTMEFGVLTPVDLAAFGAGDKVHFLLVPQKDKSYRIAAMCALDADKAAHDACMKSMHEAATKAAAASGNPCDMEMDNMDGMDHGGMKMDGAASGHKDHSQLGAPALLLASHPDESDEEHCRDHKDQKADGHDHDGDADDGHDCEGEDDDGQKA